MKRSTSQDFKSKQIIETALSSSSGQVMSTPVGPLLSSNKRRLSEHFQSSLKKFLDKKKQPDKTDTRIQGFLKSFHKENLKNLIQKNTINSTRYQSNFSILNETLDEQQAATKLDDSKIETKLSSYNASQLSISTDSFLNLKHKFNQSILLKPESLFNDEKKKIKLEFFFCDSNQSFSSLSEDKQQEKIDDMLTSKSSVNSEEGYYSNQDSSSTVYTVVNDPTQKLTELQHYEAPIYSEPPVPSQMNNRRLSTCSQITDRSMHDCNFNLPMDYSRFSYNCYSSSNSNQSCQSTTNNFHKLDVFEGNIYIGSDTEGEIGLDKLKTQLRLNKFCSLSSLKQGLFMKQFINKSSSYVSEIKLFFDNNSSYENKIKSSNCFDIQKELIKYDWPDSDAFEINIKDLISKFEKQK